MFLNAIKGAIFGLLMMGPIGCSPPPAVNEPPNQDEIGRQPDGQAENNPDAGVEVQVGGGDGVRVDVEPDATGADVDVDGGVE